MKSILLFGGIILGALIPQAHSLSSVVQYLLMLMLFIAFSGMSVTPKIFNKSIVLILLINILLGFFWYYAILHFNHTYAVIVFITAIAPTATAAPVVVHFLKGKVEYVIASVILTNVTIAILLPFFTTALGISNNKTSVLKPLTNIFIVIIVPLLIAQGIRYLRPALSKKIVKYEDVSFYAWVIVIFLAVANSSNFIRIHKEIPATNLATIALLVLMVCAVNFTLGRLIGGDKFALEASQSLGQKNTMLTVWYSLTYLSPLIALGPVCYLVYHNAYNSYQMAH